MDCIFCKIIKNEIPSYRLYEDRDVLVILDIAPVNHGHTLVISKKHYANMEEISDKELCRMIKIVKKISKAIIKGLGVKGYNIHINNNPVAGQVILHIHFHIIPRIEGDGLLLWQQKKYEKNEAEEVMKKIRLALI